MTRTNYKVKLDLYEINGLKIIIDRQPNYLVRELSYIPWVLLQKKLVRFKVIDTTQGNKNILIQIFPTKKGKEVFDFWGPFYKL